MIQKRESVMHASIMGIMVCMMKRTGMVAITATFWIKLRLVFMVTRISTTSKECIEGRRQILGAEERKLDDFLVTRDSPVNSNKMDKACRC